MSRRHDALYEEAKSAIDALFSDTTVSPSHTRESLEALMEEIAVLLDTIPDDGDEG